MSFSGQWIYGAIVLLMMTGLYILIARDNLVKKVMGLNIFQASAVLLYVSMGTVRGGTPPILIEGAAITGPGAPLYSNPLPHVLMLTAIVVGVAITALALALAVRIQSAYGTVEEDEIVEMERSGER